MATCQQEIEDDTQRVGIRGGGQRGEFDLFGTGEEQRHGTGVGLSCQRRRTVVGQHFGNPKVQQPDVARVGHENVVVLQIPVDHKIPMSELNGVAHLQKQLQPLSHVQSSTVAVTVQRLAVHIVHDQVGKAFIRGAPVEQLDDVRMVQVGQDLPLSLKPLQQLSRVSSGGQHFHGYLPLKCLIDTFRQVDDAHPSFT